MNPKARRVIDLANDHLGGSYDRNAWLLDAPKVFSCSTFTRYIFRQIGVRLPRKAIKQATCGKRVEPDSIEPGDLVFIRGTSGFYEPPYSNGIGHVGIYVGDGVVISARNEGVTKEPIASYLRSDQYRAIRRVI